MNQGNYINTLFDKLVESTVSNKGCLTLETPHRSGNVTRYQGMTSDCTTVL